MLIAYSFTAEWLKGTKNDVPYAISHNTVSDLEPHKLLAELDMDNNPDTSLTEIRSINSESLHIQELHEHSNKIQNTNN